MTGIRSQIVVGLDGSPESLTAARWAAHDARLVAAMSVHGINHLLTFNIADFKRYPAITVLSPNSVLSSES